MLRCDMADEQPENLVLRKLQEMRAENGEQFRDMRAENAAQFRELTQKVGALATTMVSVLKRLDDIDRSMQVVAVAVDDHSHRLDEIEKRLGIGVLPV